MAASATNRHYEKDLLRIPLFQGLSSEEITRIAGSVHRQTLAAGKPLLQLGHKSEEVYFLLEGTVKVSIPKSQGGCIINICGPGAVLGEISAIDEAGHSANVTAIERCHLLWMHSSRFLHHIDQVPGLSWRLLRQMVQRLRHNCQHARTMSQANVTTRLACLLLDFVRLYENFSPLEECNGGIVLPLALSQSDLAATIGTTRQSVNETLTKFRQNGWVATEKEQGGQHLRIAILDRRALEAYCKG